MSDQAATMLLAQFAHRVISQGCFTGTDVDGGTLQEWAEELGLIYPHTATEADLDQFSDLDVGDKIYFFQPWLLDFAKIGRQAETAAEAKSVADMLPCDTDRG